MGERYSSLASLSHPFEGKELEDTSAAAAAEGGRTPLKKQKKRPRLVATTASRTVKSSVEGRKREREEEEEDRRTGRERKKEGEISRWNGLDSKCQRRRKHRRSRRGKAREKDLTHTHMQSGKHREREGENKGCQGREASPPLLLLCRHKKSRRERERMQCLSPASPFVRVSVSVSQSRPLISWSPLLLPLLLLLLSPRRPASLAQRAPLVAALLFSLLQACNKPSLSVSRKHAFFPRFNSLSLGSPRISQACTWQPSRRCIT